MSKHLPTTPYKGVRDFFPEDMAVQQYIFETWAYTAESFGYERYDASVLEPSDLYRAKGAENEELLNEQTYTFNDRGNREVTLRPEMTPTVARMIAAKQRELAFPVRWYSIPNLFRYERTQRGRLREHWQLNCDIFGSNDYTADVELITLAHKILINFGADEDMFEIRINDKAEMSSFYKTLGITDPDRHAEINRRNDRFHKIDRTSYLESLAEVISDNSTCQKIYAVVSGAESLGDSNIAIALRELGISNIIVDRSIARGFDYYTGTIFEVFDKHPDGTNRAMLGGGRYDNLTGLFSDDAVSGIGFGMGDVTMRDFLETHQLLTANITSPTLVVIPTDSEHNLEAQKIAQMFRREGISVATDIGTKKVGKKLAAAGEKLIDYALVVGEDEISSGNFILKNLNGGDETSNIITELIKILKV